ncbi:hypothetical protein PM082_018919 [Marasmius tenuissimus]|nr:hypothetical protein PM082_018919 [Marasmius tenuissimus]
MLEIEVQRVETAKSTEGKIRRSRGRVPSSDQVLLSKWVSVLALSGRVSGLYH